MYTASRIHLTKIPYIKNIRNKICIYNWCKSQQMVYTNKYHESHLRRKPLKLFAHVLFTTFLVCTAGMQYYSLSSPANLLTDRSCERKTLRQNGSALLIYKMYTREFLTWYYTKFGTYRGKPGNKTISYVCWYITLRSGQNGPHFSRPHYQKYLWNETFFIQMTLKVVPGGPINNMPALV